MDSFGALTEIRDGNVTIIEFGPILKHVDETNIADVSRKLIEVTDRLPAPALILDLKSTEFFGSSFIESLFRIWKKLNQKAGAKFALANLQPYCREVLEVTHLDKLWPMYDTREAAMAAVTQTEK